MRMSWRGYSNPGCPCIWLSTCQVWGMVWTVWGTFCLRNTKFYWPIKNSDRAARQMGRQFIDNVLSPGRSRNEVVERIQINLSNSYFLRACVVSGTRNTMGNKTVSAVEWARQTAIMAYQGSVTLRSTWPNLGSGKVSEKNELKGEQELAR